MSLDKLQIVPIVPENYHKCDNIWNMDRQPQTRKWLEEIEAGIRIPFACALEGKFIGEIALVLETGDPDYTIPGVRGYLSRLLVKKEHRGRGIGKLLIDLICEKARERGLSQLSVGVDLDNAAALHLYRLKGFDEVLFEGADEHGPYVKLLKRL